MELKRLSEYVRLARAQGITRLSIGDVTFELDLRHEVTKKSKKSDILPAPASVADPVTEAPTEDELLFWSSGN